MLHTKRPQDPFFGVDVTEAGPQLVQMFIGSLDRYGEWHCWLNGLVHSLGRKTPSENERMSPKKVLGPKRKFHLNQAPFFRGHVSFQE